MCCVRPPKISAVPTFTPDLTTLTKVGRHERIAELVALDRPGLEVADLATGPGRTVRALLAAATDPVRVHAVDAASSLDDDVLHDAGCVR